MRPAGFEPATYCLEGSCSIQMSYDLLNSQWSLQICYMYTIGVKKSQPPFFCSLDNFFEKGCTVKVNNVYYFVITGYL